MEALFRFLATYEGLIYILLSLGGLFAFRWLWKSWREWHDSVFGLEREFAMRRLSQALIVSLLILFLFFGELFLASFVVPALPASDLLATPTLNVLSQTEGALSGNPTDLLNATTQPPGSLSASTSGCVPDEIILTSGMDYRIGATSMISVDGIYSIYATDKVGDKEVFASGNRLMVNLQFKKYFGYDNLWLFTRYRTKEKNVIAQAGSMDLAREEMTPNQFEYMGQFQFHPTQMMALGIVVNGRYYEDTNDYPGVNIVGFGITPEIRISQKLIIPLRFLYFLGSYQNGSRISGLETTLGFSFGF